jgi:preprotein translocase subunit SecB
MAEQDKQITIQKIYLKDFSFESPHAPMIFTKADIDPKTNLNLRSTHADIGENNHDVVLTLTVETKHEDQTLFLVEIQQSGIFNILGYDDEELGAILGSFCPGVLFPYAREAIASIVTKGGFPDFTLQPINFDALYVQSLQQPPEGEGESAAPSNGGTH